MIMKLLSLLVLIQTAHAASTSWPQFRGPNGAGVADGQHPPVHFSPGTNELWRTALPSGASSPCVWADRIFLTGFSEGKLETICLHRRDGTVRWRRVAPAERLEAFHPAEGTPASATPNTDGQRVVVYFGSCGLRAYDLEGRELWHLPLPVPRQVGDFGSGTSPVLAGDRVLLNRDQLGGSELIAVDARQGTVLWRADRPEFLSSYSTPVLWTNANRTEVVLAGFLQMRAYDVATGVERWRVRGLPVSPCPTPVLGEGMLSFAGWSPGKADQPVPKFDSLLERADTDQDGVLTFEESDGSTRSFFATYDLNRDRRITREEWEGTAAVMARGENALLAIRAGGTGDITESHVAWKQTRGLPYVPSPLYYRGRLYLRTEKALYAFGKP